MNRRPFLLQAGISATAAVLRPAPLRAARTEWERDGVGATARLGVLTPDFDPVPESEMWAMAPRGISVHAARVPWKGDPREFAEPPRVDNAVEQLLGVAPRSILFGFTSSSYALGADDDERMRARLERCSQGIPVILTCHAATAALRGLGVKRLSLIHPPWFSDASDRQGATYFRGQGFDVVQCMRIAPERQFTEVAPAELFAFVSAHTPAGAEAVFIGGNGLRAVGAIRALEARLRRPVLSANQVLLWSALRGLGKGYEVRGYGRLFDVQRSGG